MNPAKRSLIIGGIILSGSTVMTFYGAITGREGQVSTTINATLLILVLLFYRWAYRRLFLKPELTDAQKLARGLNMTDIKEELSKPCPSPTRNSSTNQ